MFRICDTNEITIANVINNFDKNGSYNSYYYPQVDIINIMFNCRFTAMTVPDSSDEYVIIMYL